MSIGVTLASGSILYMTLTKCAQAEAVPIGEARGDVVEHAGGVHGLEEPAGKPGRKLGPENSPLVVYRYPH